MPQFPSMDWCHSLVAVLEKEPESLGALREWGGLSIGVIVTKGAGLSRDWCVYVKPHATDLKVEELRECEDADDLELEEPDYLFQVPYAICKSLHAKKLDPMDVLTKGQVRVQGDMKKLLALGQKYRAFGERASDKVHTTFL